MKTSRLWVNVDVVFQIIQNKTRFIKFYSNLIMNFVFCCSFFNLNFLLFFFYFFMYPLTPLVCVCFDVRYNLKNMKR